MERIDCLGVGSPIMDTLAQVSEEFIGTTGAARGSVTLIDAEKMESVLSGIKGLVIQAPGGSAGNTVVALAKLGQQTALLGKIGDDETGKAYCNALESAGAQSDRIKYGSGANARCLSMITPDAQRTMMTHLGAAATITPDDLSEDDFASRLVYIEGYVMYNRPLMDAVIAHAEKAGAKIGLDLGSYTIVETMKEDLIEILKNHVDIVIANEDEARAMFGNIDVREQAKLLGEMCPVALLNIGAKGSIVATNGEIHEVAARKVSKVVDTTGAGDLCIAGFLHGWMNGASPEKCAACGSVLGSEVVQITGAFLPQEAWRRIHLDIAKVLGLQA